MERMRSFESWFFNSNCNCQPRYKRAVATFGVIAFGAITPIVFSPALGATASAQQTPAVGGRVSGTVTAPDRTPIVGVTVRVVGSDSAAITNEAGHYAIGAPPQGTLIFSRIGYRRLEVPVNGRTSVDVTMEAVAVSLDQVVVTSGYQGAEQRRSDITGAVATVNTATVERQTSASVLQRMDAAVSGVTVNSSGSPGSRSTVRIRGPSSFQNNDPLYIVDGTPVQDSYVNFLNPEDIASMQVLKDASAASIYGSRANNGVVIIETTKRGSTGPPRTRVSLRTGIASPVHGYDDILLTDALAYYDVVKESYLNAGYPIDSVPKNIYGDPNNPSVPAYIWPNDCGGLPCSNVDPSTYSYPDNLIMPGSKGTNWWDELFGSAPLVDANVSVTGAGTGNSYAVSVNYFDQKGTALYNRFRRGSVRANTQFNRGNFLIGENISVTGESSVGGIANDSTGEDNIVGKNILQQPVIPVKDIAGNYASGKAVGLGNNTNPVKLAWQDKDAETLNGRVFGNVFAGYQFTPQLTFRSTFGGSLGQTSFNGWTAATPENSEPVATSSAAEHTRRFTDYTWSNTLRYSLPNDRHNLSVLLGQEINQSQNRYIEGSISGLVSTSPDARYIQDVLGDASSKNVTSTGGKSALLSYFGKADYTFLGRYTASFTLRRDGSSNLGPQNQWGTFPAFGFSWRAGQEPFLRDNGTISDLSFRLGYGVTGNQQIPPGRIFQQFGGERGATYYDINGSGNSSVVGYRLVSLGNENLKWEENKSINAGMDMGLFDNQLTFIVDVYNRTTDNLLFNPALPATAGQADAPIINVGKMRNRGIDFTIGHQTEKWSLTFNGSHYNNEILRIDGAQDFFFSNRTTRIGTMVINQVGQPIGSFYGYQADGFFKDDADVAAHATQDGAAPGRIKFRDVNGDGQITLADRTIIGSPHPDFTAGLDAHVRFGRFDFSGTLFGSFGNDIFDAQKDFYVFRDFSTNVRKDLLKDSWRPDNLNAKYPRLDQNDTFSKQISSFYVDDGSYVRLRNLQVGYTVPTTSRFLGGSRLYVQGENLFTITGYDGLDPALPLANFTGAAGDIRDQWRGVDEGVYPSSRTFSIGIITEF
jgi:TonB-dependent starch-binding outer membrane protein SusC